MYAAEASPASRAVLARSDGPRDTVWRMVTFEALRERVLDRFDALGPIERNAVADPVPWFRAASS
jgi:hypothetical protein